MMTGIMTGEFVALPLGVWFTLLLTRVWSLGDPTEGLWVQQYVGSVSDAAFIRDSVVVSTEEGVLASLSADGGSLQWRQVLPEESCASVNHMQVGGQRTMSTMSCAQPSNLRTWNLRDGSLFWESSPFSLRNPLRDLTQSNAEILGAFYSVDDNTHVLVDSEDVLNVVDSRGKSKMVTTGGIDIFGELTEDSKALYDNSHSHSVVVIDTVADTGSEQLIVVFSFFNDSIVLNAFDLETSTFKGMAKVPHGCGRIPVSFDSVQTAEHSFAAAIYSCENEADENENKLYGAVLDVSKLNSETESDTALVAQTEELLSVESVWHSQSRSLGIVRVSTGISDELLVLSVNTSAPKASVQWKSVELPVTENEMGNNKVICQLAVSSQSDSCSSVEDYAQLSVSMSADITATASQQSKFSVYANGGVYESAHVSSIGGHVEKCWAKPTRNSKDKVQILALTRDGTLSLWSAEAESSLELRWQRDEALADVFSVELFEESREDVGCESEEECERVYHREFPSFIPRLVSDISLVDDLFLSAVRKAPEVMSRLCARLLASVIEKLPAVDRALTLVLGFNLNLASYFESAAATQPTISAGSKIAVVTTRRNKVFAIDTDTERMIWSVYLPLVGIDSDDAGNGNGNGGVGDGTLVEDLKVTASLKLREHPPHFAAVLSSESSPTLTRVVAINSPFHKAKPAVHCAQIGTQSRVNAAFVTNLILEDDSSDHIALLIGGAKNDEITLFPNTNAAKIQVNKHLKSLFYHVSDKRKSQAIEGFAVMRTDTDTAVDNWQFGAELLWRRSFESSLEQIVDVRPQSRGQKVVNAVYRTGFKNALHKYLNPHLIAVATFVDASSKGAAAENALGSRRRSVGYVEHSECGDLADGGEGLCGKLHVYLMDAVTGRVLLHEFHDSALRKHSSVLIFENKLIYHFYNAKDGLSEVHVKDLWLNDPRALPTEGHFASADGWLVSESPLLRLTGRNEFSSFTALNGAKPFVTSQSYHSRYVISKALTATNTRYGVTNKMVLFELAQGSIVSISDRFLNSRRPLTNEPKEEHREEGIPPYKEFLPMNGLSVMSHSHQLKRLRQVHSVSAPIESTTVVFGYGLDLFHRRLTPSGTFDRISDDFDFLVLFAILGGIVFAINAAGIYGRRKKIQEEWK